MKTTESADTALARLLARCEAPELLAGRRLLAIWLFGSRARGTARPDSDVDLGVLCDPPLGIERPRWIDVLSRESGIEVDVIDLAIANATLAWEVVTSGRLVVERDELATEAFLRRARYAAEDDARRNRMIVLAQSGTLGARE
jgi:predicted nucleotidyltransferase